MDQPSVAVLLAVTQRQTAEPLTTSLSARAHLALRGNPGQIEEGLAGGESCQEPPHLLGTNTWDGSGRRTQDQASQLGAEGLEGALVPRYQPPATFANQTHAAR